MRRQTPLDNEEDSICWAGCRWVSGAGRVQTGCSVAVCACCRPAWLLTMAAPASCLRDPDRSVSVPNAAHGGGPRPDVGLSRTLLRHLARWFSRGGPKWSRHSSNSLQIALAAWISRADSASTASRRSALPPRSRASQVTVTCADDWLDCRRPRFLAELKSQATFWWFSPSKKCGHFRGQPVAWLEGRCCLRGVRALSLGASVPARPGAHRLGQGRRRGRAADRAGAGLPAPAAAVSAGIGRAVCPPGGGERGDRLAAAAAPESRAVP